MLKIALTGGIASGKSTVAKLFAAQGVPIIDCDVLARELTTSGSPALNSIAEHFGPGILQRDGSLNRTALREIIFQKPQERSWLEALLHPLIRSRIRDELNQIQAPYCLIIIPLLSESLAQGKDFDFIDQIWVIDTPVETQLQRLQERDHCTPAQAEAIFATQHSRVERLKLAHQVIINNGDLDSLKAQVTKLHQEFQQKR